jgi:hypothetical protein
MRIEELNYYISYKGRRLGKPMTKEEAIVELFRLSNAFKNLSILIYDEHDKLRGRILRKKPPSES